MEHFRVTTGPQPVKLTIKDYELLLESGALTAYQRVELIEGVIVEMNAERAKHNSAKMAVTFRLRDALERLSSGFEVRCEPTIRLSRHSLPEPDVIVIKPVPSDDDYISGESVKIVVEVAHSSRVNDLGYKYELYGGYGMPEYWIVDLREDKVHVFWEPTSTGYKQQAVLPLGERLDSRTIPDLSIETANLY